MLCEKRKKRKKKTHLIAIGRILDKVTVGKKCIEKYLTNRNKMTGVQNLVEVIEGYNVWVI